MYSLAASGEKVCQCPQAPLTLAGESGVYLFLTGRTIKAIPEWNRLGVKF
jgi:hypothetical protein